MKSTGIITNITSADPETLMAFYQGTVGLELDETTHTFPMGEGSLFAIDGHNDTHGKTKEPSRTLVSFQITDLAGETARLKAAGVECIRDEGREYWGGTFSTFIDPDGNYFQLCEYKPE